MYYYKDISLRDAQVLAVKILKRVMEEKINSKNLQVAVLVAQNEERVDDSSNTELTSLCGLSAQQTPQKKKSILQFLNEEELNEIISQI